MKECIKCHKVKPLNQFYAHSQMKDGHLNKCITCTKKERREHEHGHPDLCLESRLKAHQKNPTKKSADRIVCNAIKAGQLIKADYCCGCGVSSNDARIEAHHYDYTKPLDVTWVCTQCHRRLDESRILREDKEALLQSGLSQREIAKRYHISQRAVWNWFQTKREEA